MATLVNICGTARSGSTMLDLMLGNAPDAFSCGEVYAWFRPFRTHHFEIACSCKANPCPYWERVKCVPERYFHKEVFERLKVNYVIDSSKDPAWVIDNNKWSSLNNIRVVNILLWKDPVDLAYSFWKRGGGVWAWKREFVTYYGRLIKYGLPFISINFSELVRQPEKKLRELCNYVGMEYFQGKEMFWLKEHHHLFGSAGTRRQVENKNSSIRAREEYPEEFLEKKAKIEEAVTNDDELKSLLDVLVCHEMSRNIVPPKSGLSYSRSKIYPAWYYISWIKRKYRRHFPQEMPDK